MKMRADDAALQDRAFAPEEEIPSRLIRQALHLAMPVSQGPMNLRGQRHLPDLLEQLAPSHIMRPRCKIAIVVPVITSR